MKRMNAEGRRGVRREEAEARQAAADRRTPEEQLARLQVAGHGDCAEARALEQTLNIDLKSR